ncbi:MAG: NAD-dependent deacylase [Chloroflexi bacterium]|nr:NAD-dependent deacylase [Chloroflexota bacterium]
MSVELGKKIEALADLIIKSKRIMVFTGAGISTESGIPDFRGPDGLWTKFDINEFTFDKFLTNIEARKRHWLRFGTEDFLGGAQPNPAHYAIVELERMDKLDCLITQNIDGLHHRAGTSPDKIIELHGTVREAKCLSCEKHFPIDEIRKRWNVNDDPPLCEHCGGLLKVATISFGESMPVRETAEAQRLSGLCDLCIVIGSSLVVYPAAYMPQIAYDSGAKLAIINMSDTPMDQMAHVRIFEKAGEVMPQVVKKITKSS